MIFWAALALLALWGGTAGRGEIVSVTPLTR